ncbi:M1 family metallopeptidase [Aquincola sp. S2]|uniref:Aminopeptidase n=1 Tax=Pseudaquabacterium terrae TaxID=2732868 RepID=A0ABX2EDJ3_9BURK|nr:M1 family metallopeptidase [Aquabacterium terrae]NRF66325.1 M1 family metallopeptidase [Aquabacterium terrae]
MGRLSITGFRAVVAAFVSLLALAVAQAQPRFDFDRTPGRLPKDALPLRYTLTLDLDPQREHFDGTVAIELRARRALPALLLHAHELETTGAVTLKSERGAERTLRIEPDAAASLWRLVPADGAPIAAGRHCVHITYRGRVRNSGEGLYRIGSGADRMLATQLQAVFARTLFPSFDEPAFRAVFRIAVRAPQGLQVASNMPVERVRRDGAQALHTFAPTPPMPSYLVAVTVGHFETLTGRAASVPLRFLTAPGKAAQARYALGATQLLLPYYNRYFGQPYALPKLDQIAVPGVRDGAMEDWGLISYNESLLLVDPKHSGPDTPRWVFALLAHEIAHQWFGNLVTASSWDEIWLNEAFATWMENKASEHFNPQWQTPLHTRRWIDQTMARDASGATRAIRSGPVDERQVSDQFDDITYTKGGAVLSMLEQWLGDETFRRGLAAYMRDRRHSNASAGDLWHFMGRASGRDVAALAASWTDQPGVPLVQLDEACEGGQRVVTLSQQRFSADAGAAPSAQRWQIPVRLQQGQASATVLLAGDTARQTFAGCDGPPVLANAGGRGYYRVMYASTALQQLTAQFHTLAPADRSTLLSDSFALAQAGALPFGAYLALLDRLPAAQGAGRGALFAQAGDALVLLDEALAGLPVQQRLRERARALLAPELQRLGWQVQAGEASEDTSLRARLIELLARFDDAAVIGEARARFDADAAGRAALPAALRPGVLGAVGMHATRAEFDRLRAQLLAAGGEEERWLLAGALAGGRTRALVDEVLALSLAGTLPPNIASALPGLVGEAGVFGAEAYAFSREHWAALAKLAGTGPFGGNVWLLPSAAKSFNDPAQAAQLVADQHALAGAPGTAAASRIAARIALRAAMRPRAAAALESGS